jgi:hypothetical protein
MAPCDTRPQTTSVEKKLMGNRLATCLLALSAFVSMPAPGNEMHAGGSPCGKALVQHIPARPAQAPTGSEFVRSVEGLSDDARETAVRDQFLAGNVPGFLRRLRPVVVGLEREGVSAQVTACVAPDYLAIGSDHDYVLMPMRLETALAVANRYGFTLPTRRLVDAIYSQAAVHLTPQPLPAGESMRSTDYYRRHNHLIRRQRDATGPFDPVLTAGHKKDLVLTNRLWSHLERVAIYGWHRATGKPIQPLSTVHGWRYADYSHGVRLVSTFVLMNGHRESIYNVLGNSQSAALLSDEGVMKVPKLVDILATRTSARMAASPPP